MKKESPADREAKAMPPGRRKDPRLEALISDWKKGERDRWRGHGKSEGKRKR